MRKDDINKSVLPTHRILDKPWQVSLVQKLSFKSLVMMDVICSFQSGKPKQVLVKQLPM